MSYSNKGVDTQDVNTAVMDQNQIEVDLLYNNPNELIENYQEIIHIIVKKYIGKRLFNGSEKEDVVQFVNEKILTEKIKKIQEQYDHSTYLRTYFSRIVQNLCFEYRRKFKQLPTMELKENELFISPDFNDMLIRDELRRFAAVIKLFQRFRCKLLLCLKLISRIKISDSDLLNYHPQCTATELSNLTSRFGKDYSKMKDKEIYSFMTPFFNKCEGKNSSVDALRKWLDEKTSEIINILNGNPPQASYDKETLKILVQKYYESNNL